MINFPLFSELEAKRDRINAAFHKETEPQLVERLKQFGFQPVSEDMPGTFMLCEQSTGNRYLRAITRYTITVRFQHVRNGETVKICEISNLELNAHEMLQLIIRAIDSYLQYGLVIDYEHLQFTKLR